MHGSGSTARVQNEQETRVPETSKKLIQATGRLLRNEKDTGTITLMDKRLVTKRYGQQLLDSLPPYQIISKG